MQFFINASGCKGRITPQMQATMEHVSIIRKMTEEFDEVNFLLFSIFFRCFFLNNNYYFLGKWGISINNDWTTMEKISSKFL